MLLGIIIGVIVGAGAMYLVKNKKVSELTTLLSEVQAKLKTTRSQLYRKRASYKKKTNGSNGKKAKAVKRTTKKKASANIKKANIQ
jgi:gas vesicle protein